MTEDSLWGAEFNVPDSINKTKKILKKIATPKIPRESSIDNQIKSKKLSLEDKLILIRVQNLLFFVRCLARNAADGREINAAH